MPSVIAVVTISCASSLLAGCAQTYHPEYHPETRYSFVQNISYGVPAETERCKLGRAGECWRECFHGKDGEACYLLGVMFETGHGVPRSHDDAARMSALASRLGYAPATIDVEMAAPYIDLWGHDKGKRVHGSEAVTRAGAGYRRLLPQEFVDESPYRESGNVSSPGGIVIYGSVNGDIVLGH